METESDNTELERLQQIAHTLVVFILISAMISELVVAMVTYTVIGIAVNNKSW